LAGVAGKPLGLRGTPNASAGGVFGENARAVLAWVARATPALRWRFVREGRWRVDASAGGFGGRDE